MMPEGNEPNASYRPCLVLAHSDPVYSRDAARRLRRLGWDVYLAAAGGEARRLARMMGPELAVLDVGLADESGWLVCAKLRREAPEVRVVLLGDAGCPVCRERAAFVGASCLLRAGDNLAVLLSGATARPAVAA